MALTDGEVDEAAELIERAMAHGDPVARAAWSGPRTPSAPPTSSLGVSRRRPATPPAGRRANGTRPVGEHGRSLGWDESLALALDAA